MKYARILLTALLLTTQVNNGMDQALPLWGGWRSKGLIVAGIALVSTLIWQGYNLFSLNRALKTYRLDAETAHQELKKLETALAQVKSGECFSACSRGDSAGALVSLTGKRKTLEERMSKYEDETQQTKDHLQQWAQGLQEIKKMQEEINSALNV